jgi:sugar fermentation stimulation protein A
MHHAQPLIPARVVDQPNRFTVRVALDAHSPDSAGPAAGTVGAYLANTGNLASILRPGIVVRVTPAVTAGRKLPYTLVLARQWGRWVAVDANLSASLAAEAIEARALPGFRAWRLVRREPPIDGGRLDLLLQRGERRLWMEVKCTTLVRNGVARFPNPATARGARHVRALTALARSGEDAAICFVAQRSDARAFRTLEDVDPDFVAALEQARAAGVRCHAYRARVSQRAVTLLDEIPVLG